MTTNTTQDSEMYQVKIGETRPLGNQIILAAWKHSREYKFNCNPFFSTVFLSRSESHQAETNTYGYEF